MFFATSYPQLSRYLPPVRCACRYNGVEKFMRQNPDVNAEVRAFRCGAVDALLKLSLGSP